MRKRYLLLLVVPLIILTACEAPEWGSSAPTVPAAALGTQASVVETATASPTVAAFSPTEATTNAEATTPTLTLVPDAWKSLPIVPQVSERMIEVYRAGLAAGHNPTHFSKIGDCQNITTYFLAEFDDPTRYRLGSKYASLQPTIDYFAGSWSRESLAVKGGMNVAAVQNPFWTLTPRPAVCKTNESPLACELRVYNPSIAIISMEESWSGDIGKYDRYLRKIVEYVLSQNVVPILVTRAETANPDVSINATVARVAYDYQVPLWNFWAAAYPLPAHGLTSDDFHLTWAGSFFDDPQRMQMGWPWRNLTALQAIDAVYHDVNSTPTATATPTSTSAPTPTLTPTANPAADPDDWQSRPVVPSVSDEMKAVYQKGLELGNRPNAFSKIGDGEISSEWFLTDFDLGAYKLGPYTDLRLVIGKFFGSYGRVSQAAEDGFTTSLILDPAAADQQVCNEGESPLDCELRLHKPSFAFISLGATQIGEPEVFEAGLRQVVTHLLEKGVVPILSTKADNLEGDNRINQVIASVALEYHVPLWNFWSAVQPLPGHGLQDDMASLTYAEPDFSDASDMLAAWPWRNLTALQVLDAVWRSVTGQ